MVDSLIIQARNNLGKVIEVLDSRVIGHEKENRMIILCLIAKEHAVMIGKWGTAKSYTFSLLSKLLGAKFWKYLFTRTTTDIEVLGAFDIPALRDRGELRRKWTELKDADIALILTEWDEFKNLDFSNMRRKIVIDGRNIVENRNGIDYEGIAW